MPSDGLHWGLVGSLGSMINRLTPWSISRNLLNLWRWSAKVPALQVWRESSQFGSPIMHSSCTKHVVTKCDKVWCVIFLDEDLLVGYTCFRSARSAYTELEKKMPTPKDAHLNKPQRDAFSSVVSAMQKQGQYGQYSLFVQYLRIWLAWGCWHFFAGKTTSMSGQEH